MKKQIIKLLLFGVTLVCYSQNQKIIISGFVYDSISKEVLIGANIYQIGSKIGVSSNPYGFYSLTALKKDTVKFKVSFIGYKTKEIILIKTTDEEYHYDILLESGISLNEVSIIENRNSNIVRSNETSVTHLKMKQVKVLPNLFGEVDIIKALQHTPGVQSGGEAKSNLYVRGGSPDQNLFLLDGVPLYYVGHFAGFFSVFNADAINDIKLIKGGFPAEYGSRLSSVLDIKMKEGDMFKRKIQGTIGLLSSKISVSAPLLKDKSSFIISARSNIIPLFKLIGAPFNYNFYDINFKLNYILSKKDRVFLSFYSGNDILLLNNKKEVADYNNQNKSLLKWGNTLGAFRWNHVYNSKLFSNLIISDTYYRYKTKTEYSYENDTLNKSISDQLTTGINDINLKFNFFYYINTSYKLRFGINSIYHTFTPNDENYHQEGTDIETLDSFYSSKTEAYENAVYLENHVKLNLFTSNIGLRFSSYHVGHKSYYSLEPRILFNYIIREDLSIKYSYSKMNQYVHLLSYSGTGVPSDYWMPSTETIKPEYSIQNTFGITKTLKNGMFQLTLESYHKSMQNLITFSPGKSLSGNLNDWETLVETNGKGKNYGIELFFQKVKGKTTGWIGATVAKAYRQFEGVNYGKEYLFKYDRLFDISIVAIHKLKDNINLSATWSYGSGYPITLATEKYQQNGNDILIYEEKNSFRMRDYHRLDVAANFNKKTKWGERTWIISIFNLYNRQNPYYYYYDREFTMITKIENGGIGSTPQIGDLKLYQRSLFSIFPSTAYSFKF